MSLSTLTVDLNVRLARFEEDLKQSVRHAKEATDTIKGAFESLEHTLGAIGIGIGLGEVLREAVATTIEYERSQTRLAATLKATGYAAGFTADELEQMGEAMAHSTAFSTIDIRDAEAEILKWRDISGQSFKDVLKLSLDFATFTRTTASEAAHTLARAYENPVAAMRQLRQAGVDLASQKDLLQHLTEVGDVTERSKILTQALTDAIGGQAAAGNVGLYGATRSLSKAWEELIITMSKSELLRSTVGGTLGFLAQAFKDFDEDISQLKGADTLAKKITALARLLDPGLGEHGAARRKNLFIPEVVEPTTPAERAEAAKARAGPDEQTKRREAEAARLAAFQALKDRAAAAAAGMQQILQIERLGAAEQNNILQTSYDRGLVSIEQFYSQRTAIANKAFGQELIGLQQAIKAQEAFRASPSATSEERSKSAAEIAKLKGQQRVIEEQAANVATSNTLKMEDAQQAYRDSINLTTVAILEQQGRFEEAAKKRIEVEQRVRNLQLGQQGSQAERDQQADWERRIVVMAALSQAQSHYNTLREQEAAQELGIQTRLAQSGGNPEDQLRALRDTNAARLGSLPALEAATRAARDQAAALGNEEVVANLDRELAALRLLRAESSGAAAAAREFQISEQKGALLFRQEANAEQDVQNLRTSGSISALDMEVRLDRAREASIANLQKQADALQVIANRTGNEDDLQRVREMRTAIEGLAAAAHSAANIFQGIFQDSFADAFVSFAQGARTAKQAFGDFALSVVQGLERIAAQQVAQYIFGNLAGTGIFGSMANIFSGASSGAGAGATASYGQRMAKGGITSGPTLAGEGGQPEAVIPLSGGRFVPVKMTGGGSGGDTNISITVNTDGTVTGGKGGGDQLGLVLVGAIQRQIVIEKGPGGLLARQ